MEQARKRRRICIGVFLFVIVIVIIASVAAGTQANKGVAAISALDDPNAVKFYVTADVPYDANQQEKIIRDKGTIPREADFVIHL